MMWKPATSRLLDRGVPMVIITLGRNVALLADGKSMVHIPAYQVKAIDATAAGDAFIGCLAAGLARIEDAFGSSEIGLRLRSLDRNQVGRSGIAAPL
jgi:ribokinase